MWDIGRQKMISEVMCGAISRVCWTGCGTSFATSDSNGIKLWEHQSPKPLEDQTKFGSFGSMDSQDSQMEWIGRDLAGINSPCTDLKSTSSYLAASFKNGLVLRWKHGME